MVADEVRRILGHHHALAETMVGEMADGLDHLGPRLRRRDDLEQMEIARRVEEVCAEPVPPEVVAPPLRERRDRNARRVGGDDRTGAADGVDLREQSALDVELLDDRFDDPVALARCDSDRCRSRRSR